MGFLSSPFVVVVAVVVSFVPFHSTHTKTTSIIFLSNRITYEFFLSINNGRCESQMNYFMHQEI